MHKLVYLLFIVLVAGLIYMITMPFIMLYEDQQAIVEEEVTYFIPEGGLQSHYHKEVEMAKGKRAREREAKAAEANSQE